MMKLIVFINESNFSALFSSSPIEGSFKDSFVKYERGIPSFFNSNSPERIIYIDDQGKFEFADFDAAKANKASIVIFPDTFNCAYCPDDEFVILRHGTEPKILQNLEKCPKFKCKLQQEETQNFNRKQSLYYLLLTQFIGKEDVTFSDFFEEHIKKECNQKLNSALEFLHGCLGGTIADTSILTKAGFVLDENSKSFSITDLITKLSNGGDRNAALKDVRDALLEIALKE